MSAIGGLNESALVAQSIWEAQQGAAKEYRRQRKLAAAGDLAAGQLADNNYRLFQALVQAAAVRLTPRGRFLFKNSYENIWQNAPEASKPCGRSVAVPSR